MRFLASKHGVWGPALMRVKGGCPKHLLLVAESTTQYISVRYVRETCVAVPRNILTTGCTKIYPGKRSFFLFHHGG